MQAHLEPVWYPFLKAWSAISNDDDKVKTSEQFLVLKINGQVAILKQSRVSYLTLVYARLPFNTSLDVFF